ncbi:hypothetical protein CHLNCDRAFT_58365 [Chlorella variabilis]|uniref:Uncharacterized protein n=1 Tax=Chlorella variabilis TaxID=554065 RepID=E1ZJL7_CHLVA|nr:hypothetical protein CHLNCDRAFT_58365 [Chlorella variabilis]EFN54011.1 hypothetical protein CHLNCDRAFT_58365 [Chlorella variabilis]|eukprot:XP_005846113.1 hypothetical protein CHLNCDRAFT_58365 [Chlorella variabilis]
MPPAVTYGDDAFGGRENFLPLQRDAIAIIGKRSKKFRRRLNHSETHRITGYEVKPVVPAAAPPKPLPVTAIDVARGGTATLRTQQPHQFSGAKQLVTLAGLSAELDGFYAVEGADQKKDRHKLTIKLPATAGAVVADFLQQVQEQQQQQQMQQDQEEVEQQEQDLFTVREEYVLDSEYVLYHFVLTGEAEEMPAAPQQQQQQQQQQVVTAGVPALAAELPPGVFEHMPLVEGGGLAGMNGHWHYEDLFGGQGGLGGGLPGASLLLTQAGHGAGAGPALSSHAQAAGPAGSQQGQQGQQQQQDQAGGAAMHLPGSPAASTSGERHSVPQPWPPPAAAPGEHAQAEGHYSLLTVGGQQPVAGRGEYAGKALVVQGDAQVLGDMTVRGLPVVSDASMKEGVRAFEQGEKAVAIAAEITTYLYRYKGTDAQRLGVVAQQVRAVLEQHGATDMNLVRQDPQGALSVDYGGLQVLLPAAVQQLLADRQELKKAQSTMQLTVLGQMQELAEAVKVLQLAAVASSCSSSETAAAASTASSSASGSSAMLAGMAGEEDQDEASLAFLMDGGDVEMESSVGEAEEAWAQDDSSSPPSNDFAALTDEQATDFLMQRLAEQPGARKLYMNLVSKLSRGALWKVYEQMLRAAPELTAAGDRLRSLGGAFIKQAKRRISEEELRRKAAGVGPAPQALRGYQQRAVTLAATGRNMIVVGDTGSGKTVIAVARAVDMTLADPSARTVFLAPTVQLVQQQTAVFLSYPSFSSGALRATGRTSDNPVAPRDWQRLLEDNHVVVMTPQLFLNMLNAGAAHFHQISLLVVDECHHAQADHPVNKVMRHNRSSARTTQVLGLTASPASRDSLDATLQALHQLELNLDAQLYVVDESDEELRAAVPEVQGEEVLVDLAPLDDGLGRRLGAFVVTAVQELTLGLGLSGEEGERPAAVVEEAAAARHDATCALLLVRAAVAALALAADVGFEAAVRYLSQEYYRVAAMLVEAMRRGGGMPLSTALLQRLAQEVEAADVLTGACSAGPGLLSRHPKFEALRDFLLEYRGADTFHGIVFCRTREAVRSLARLISDTPDLQFVEASRALLVYRFMGHGNRRGAGSGGGGGGMTSKEQRAAMEAFRQPGCRLLVSTSAGEEGIDVPRCEFVVRYSAAQTGRERVQSAGRARKLGSRFVEIVERSPPELQAAELLATISLAAIAAAIGTTVVTGATLLVFSSVSGVASSVQSVESRLAVVEQGQRRFESATGAQLQQMEQGQRRFESATGAQLQQMEKGQLRFERATGAQLQQMEEGQRRFESATGAKLQQMEQDQQRFDSATEAKLQELEQNQRLIVVLILLSFVVALLMNLLG